MTAAPSLPLLGPGQGRARGRSPFSDVVPTLWLVAVYAVLVATWVVAGPVLPGERWLAVHLFTLGVLTNAILAFSEHFSRAVTRTPGERAWWWTWIANLGIVLLLVGLPTGWLPLLAAGATIITAVVFLAWYRLRRMRRQAVGARFAWIVRVYERAHGQFVHAAVLGAVLGLGLVPGSWYTGVRLAHLHANVLGWGGLTLMATLVFFGPTMARVQIEPGADDRAARALRWGATGLTAAVLLLLLLGLPGVGGSVARIAATVGLVVYAGAVTRVCLPVWRAVYRARVTGPRPLVLGAATWLPIVAWSDVLVVGTAGWRWLDGLGLVALAGVLAQAISATLVYLAPMLRGRTTGDRETVRYRLEVGTRTRGVVFNLGVLLVVMDALRLGGALPFAAVGWGSLLVVLLVTAVTAGWPLRRAAEVGDDTAGRA